MEHPIRHTKIVATIGPASRSPEMISRLMSAGLDVARLNFSHDTREEHAATIAKLRTASAELGSPITILQDLQGPKVRVGQLPGGQTELIAGQEISLVPEAEHTGNPGEVPIDYPFAAEEAKPGMDVLLADGLMQLKVSRISGRALVCTVAEGGVLKSRKGVNFPGLNLRLPSLTEKDRADLLFGLEQGVDWISLSFVRTAGDIRELKQFIASRGVSRPVIAKIEKPQAVEHLDEIIAEADGIMVARGDLGVEMRPEKVPMIQKRIIEQSNRAGKPVITATQMLESMIEEPNPTRAEASDVANAIIDGTDAVMLSGESAVGKHPVRAVEMMVRIARDVESRIQFKSYPPAGESNTHALSRAANVVEDFARPACIVALTTTGYTARLLAAERPSSLVVAITSNAAVYHGLNLLWGLKPVLVPQIPNSFEALVDFAASTVRERQLAREGERIIVLGGVPAGLAGGTNFLKIHNLA